MKNDTESEGELMVEWSGLRYSALLFGGNIYDIGESGIIKYFIQIGCQIGYAYHLGFFLYESQYGPESGA